MNDMDFEVEESSSSNDEDCGGRDEDDPVKCLFCDDILSSPESGIPHCKSVHQFDFESLMKKFNMDCYSFIKLINFIRRTSSAPECIMQSETPAWNDDVYLKPVIQFDPWLMFDFERHFRTADNQCPEANDDDPLRVLKSALKQKKDEIATLVNIMEQMRILVHKFLEEENDTNSTNRINGSMSDHSYFESYNHPGIHFDMLADEIRTVSYKDAITCNEAVFSGKTILDLGCGTGILSMFAVSSGAREVLAIDNSDIIIYTHDIIRENKMEDKINVIKSRIEDVDLPVQRVDVIISEWMGYFLLFEGMLDSLIYARDRYLTSDGVLVPDKCDMFMCGANDPGGHKNNITFWSNVYGYRMSCIQKETMKQAVVDIIPPEKIVTTRACIASLNLYSCTVADSEFESEFKIIATQDTIVTTLVGYFDVFFNLEHAVQFSTSPSSPATHWKQTLFHIHEPIPLKKDETLNGILKCSRSSKNRRSLKITIHIHDKIYVYNLD